MNNLDVAEQIIHLGRQCDDPVTAMILGILANSLIDETEMELLVLALKSTSVPKAIKGKVEKVLGTDRESMN